MLNLYTLCLVRPHPLNFRQVCVISPLSLPLFFGLGSPDRHQGTGAVNDLVMNCVTVLTVHPGDDSETYDLLYEFLMGLNQMKTDLFIFGLRPPRNRILLYFMVYC